MQVRVRSIWLPRHVNTPPEGTSGEGSAGLSLSAGPGSLLNGVLGYGAASLSLGATGQTLPLWHGSASLLLDATGEGRSGSVMRGSATLRLRAHPGRLRAGTGGAGFARLSLSTARNLTPGPLGIPATEHPRLLLTTLGAGSASLSLSAAGLLAVAEAFEAWLMNLSTRGHAQYSGYLFNSLFILDGRHYGISSLGIEELEGADDNGVAIDAVVRPFASDLGSPFEKRLIDLLLQLRTEGDLTVDTIHGEAERRTGYDVSADGNPGMHTRRRKLAKGNRETLWTFELRNALGADFELAEAVLLFDELNKI